MQQVKNNRVKQFIHIFFLLLSSSAFAQNAPYLLEVVQPKISGIDFNNTVIETEVKNIFINGMPYLYAGGGVSVGDINNDGLMDVLLVGNEVESKLYLNKGNLQFEDITLQFGIKTSAWCTGATMCDINGDGWLDIYILKAQNVDSTTGGNLLYINQQGKKFIESSKNFGLDINSQSLSASFFDMDNDGDLDLYLAIYPNISEIGDDISWDFNKKFKPIYGGDILFENLSNHHFKNISAEAGIMNENGFGISVITADINQDGWMDIYVGNDFAEPDYLYLNNGNKTFTESIKSKMAHTSFFTMGLDCKDINNDLLPDIISLDMNPEDIVKYKTDFNTFDYELSNKTKKNFYNQEIRNTLQIQNPFGTFSDIAQIDKIAFTDWSWSPLIVDLNNDGLKDIFITNGLKKNILNQNMFLFEIDSILRSQDNSTSSLSNLEKLSYIPAMKEQNYFFQNNGDNHFSNESYRWTNAPVSVSTGAAYADFDNDGDLEIITNEIDTFPLLYKNNAIEINTNNFIGFDLMYNNHIAYGAKVFVFLKDKIYFQELNTTCGIMSNSTNRMLFGLGKNTVVDSVWIFYLDTNSVCKIDIPNINQYHNIDLAKPAKFSTSLYKLIPTIYNWNLKEIIKNDTKSDKDDFKFQSLLYQKYSKTSAVSLIYDINKDNLDDIIYGAFGTKPTQIFIQNSNHIFTPLTNSTNINKLNATVSDLLITDINKDGIEELYIAYTDFYYNSNDTIPKKYFEAFNINISKQTCLLTPILNIPSISSPISIIRLFNNDIYLIGSTTLNTFPSSNKSYIMIHQNNIFLLDTFKIEGYDINNTIIKDINIKYNETNQVGSFTIANHYAPSNRLNINSNATNYNIQNIATNGLWNKCKSIDLNQDGLEDYILLNFGINTRFNLKAENKLTLFTKDFDNNNQKDPVTCIEINKENYPMYTFNFFTSYFPYSRKKVYNYNAYSTMPLRGIYDIKNADIRFIETLKSQITLNDLSKIELPAELQWTTLNDVYVDTLHKIMYFAGNNKDTRSDIGYNDAASIIILAYTNENHQLVFKKPIINNIPNLYVSKIESIKCNDGRFLLLNTNKGIYLTNIKTD